MGRIRKTDTPGRKSSGMSRRKFVVAAGAGAALAAGSAFVPKRVFAASMTKVKLTLGWLPQGTSSWTYASLPFWEKDGIEVSIEKGSGSALAAQQIGQGQYEFGVPAGPNGVQQAIKGLPLLGLATLSYDTSMGIAVLADGPIKTPMDLNGKTVGSTLTSGEYPFLPAFYKNAGVDASSIKSVAVDNKVRERSLLDGLVDAISCFGTSAVPPIMAAGKTPKVFLYSKFGLPFYGNTLTTSPAYFEKNKSLCEAMTIGICEGIKATLLEPAKTIDKMFDEVPEFKMAASAREQAEIGLGLWAALSTVPESVDHAIGYSDPAVYKLMTDVIFASASKEGDKKPDSTTLMTNEFIGAVKLSAAEWAQVKEQFGTYAAIMS
jgi:ABC-type nitrate/sulfonate/bicarbonate transport system substrate-binding protein